MLKPTIHRNGSSAATLLEGYRSAGDAVRNALEVLREVAPNGRDYYPQGQGALSTAIHEHEDRAGKLREVLRDLEALAEHVSDAS